MLKEDDEIDNVWQVYLMDNQKKYLGAVSLEDLIIFEHNLKFSDIPIEKISVLVSIIKQISKMPSR
jgi:magnesium transporter